MLTINFDVGRIRVSFFLARLHSSKKGNNLLIICCIIWRRPFLLKVKFTKKYFSAEEPNWPAQNTDLNHIQHLWDELKYQVLMFLSLYRSNTAPLATGTSSIFMLMILKWNVYWAYFWSCGIRYWHYNMEHDLILFFISQPFLLLKKWSVSLFIISLLLTRVCVCVCVFRTLPEVTRIPFFSPTQNRQQDQFRLGDSRILTDLMSQYDLDDLDVTWLELVNAEFRELGMDLCWFTLH